MPGSGFEPDLVVYWPHTYQTGTASATSSDWDADTYYCDSGTTATGGWNGSITCSSTSITMDGNVMVVDGMVYHVYPTQVVSETEEEYAARMERERVWAEQREAERQERERVKAKAAERAESLLRMFLDNGQIKDLDDHNWFMVYTRSGKRFRIRRGRVRNVDELDVNGQPIARFCIHPWELVPDADTMLFQMLMLETDEDGFRARANVQVLN